MMAGPNPLELVLLMLLSGGFGFSSGMPPAAEDPLAAKVAPAECLFYATWAGSAEPNAASANSTEKMLAEPQVKKFLEHGSKLFSSTGSIDPELDKILQLVQGKPGAVFVTDVTPPRGADVPGIRGAGLLRIGEDGDALKALLEQYQSKAPPGSVTSVQVGNRPFSRIELGDDSPGPITWGVAGQYFIFGLGDGSAEELMQRARGEAPAWLSEARKKLAVPRTSSVMHVNVQKLVQLVIAAADDPQAARGVAVLGLDKLRGFTNVTGLDEKGCLSRALLSVEGQPSGVLSWMDAEPLTPDDLQLIDGRAPVAIVFQLDALKTFDLWMGLASQIDPREAQAMMQSLSELEQQVGFKIRDDLLASLGDTWKIFAQPGPQSLITGWTIALEVKDRPRLERVQQTYIAMANEVLKQAGPNAPSIKTSTVSGHTVHTVALDQAGIPVAPSWCITDEELLVTVSPDMLNPLLLGQANAVSLAEQADVKPLLGTNARTLAVAYADTRSVAQSLLPLAKFAIDTWGQQAPVPLDTSNLPAAEAVIRHLQPTLISLRRTQEGVELTSHQTLPGANIGASAPAAVALLLPAVSAAREAARRMESMNNLKQIALAMHNFHDTYRTFPAGYSADKDGKPLLSWRVHVLPFVEGADLYEQFHLDEPWDSPHNKQLIEQMPNVFRSPNSKAEPGMTNYLGVSGADGLFVRPQNGDRLGVGMRNVTDGTSNTLMFVEVADPQAVIWTKPADFAPGADDPLQGLLGMRPGGFLVALTDGSVRFIAETVDKGVLNALFTKAGGEAVRVP